MRRTRRTRRASGATTADGSSPVRSCPRRGSARRRSPATGARGRRTSLGTGVPSAVDRRGTRRRFPKRPAEAPRRGAIPGTVPPDYVRSAVLDRQAPRRCGEASSLSFPRGSISRRTPLRARGMSLGRGNHQSSDSGQDAPSPSSSPSGEGGP